MDVQALKAVEHDHEEAEGTDPQQRWHGRDGIDHLLSAAYFGRAESAAVADTRSLYHLAHEPPS